MRVYHLEEPLTDADLCFVAKILDLQPPRAGPHPLRPATDRGRGDYMEVCKKHEALLQKSGIARDSGRQVGFVAPKDTQWSSALLFAIRAETGRYPFVIQTVKQRAAVGNPGSLRVLNAEGLISVKEE